MWTETGYVTYVTSCCRNARVSVPSFLGAKFRRGYIAKAKLERFLCPKITTALVRPKSNPQKTKIQGNLASSYRRTLWELIKEFNNLRIQNGGSWTLQNTQCCSGELNLSPFILWEKIQRSLLHWLIITSSCCFCWKACNSFEFTHRWQCKIKIALKITAWQKVSPAFSSSL